MGEVTKWEDEKQIMLLQEAISIARGEDSG